MLIRVIGALLVIWLAFLVLGVVIKGLVVLAVIARSRSSAPLATPRSRTGRPRSGCAR